MTEKRIDWWNIFFVLLFLIELYIAYRALLLLGRLPDMISLGDATILALATFRLTRLVVYDAITKWFRNLFVGTKEYTFLGTLNTLIHCPWCVGLWAAFFVATVYFLIPESWFFMFILALGGVATLVQLFANLIGWNAEYKKRMTQSLDKKDSEASGTCG
jgi:hypothetical protein